MADHRVRVVFEFESKCQHAEIRCLGCKRAVIYPPALAVQRFGALTHLDQLGKRLKCRECGRRGASIRGIYRDYHG